MSKDLREEIDREIEKLRAAIENTQKLVDEIPDSTEDKLDRIQQRIDNMIAILQEVGKKEED